ncbi:MAG: hypothetical protein WC850_00590 [Candidatus Gracilibacteria bacterium]
MNQENRGEIQIFQTSEGKTEIQVIVENETIWINSKQIGEIFGKDRSTIERHIKNIYGTGELDEKGTCAKNAQVQNEGDRKVIRDKKLYNLDLILSV